MNRKICYFTRKRPHTSLLEDLQLKPVQLVVVLPLFLLGGRRGRLTTFINNYYLNSDSNARFVRENRFKSRIERREDIRIVQIYNILI